MTAIAGLVGAYLSADVYRQQLEQRAVRQREDCWSPVHELRCLLDYELLRMGLLPQNDLWGGVSWWFCQCCSDPDARVHKIPVTQPQERFFAGIYRQPPRSLAGLLSQLAREDVPGCALPVRVEQSGSSYIVAVFSARRGCGWAGETVASRYLRPGQRVTLDSAQVWPMLNRLGAGLELLEALEHRALADPRDLPLDERGEPMLIPGFLPRSDDFYRPHSEVHSPRDSLTLLQLWTQVGLLLLGGEDEKPGSSPLENDLRGLMGTPTTRPLNEVVPIFRANYGDIR